MYNLPTDTVNGCINAQTMAGRGKPRKYVAMTTWGRAGFQISPTLKPFTTRQPLEDRLSN